MQQWVNPEHADVVAEYERLEQDGPIRGFLIRPTAAGEETQPE